MFKFVFIVVNLSVVIFFNLIGSPGIVIYSLAIGYCT